MSFSSIFSKINEYWCSALLSILRNGANIPKRIGIIMDGNRRWAKEKHNVAIKKLGDISTSTDADRNQVQTGRDETQSMHGILEMLSEIRRLETEWENNEYKWQVDEQNKPVMPDDIKLVFGV